MPGMFAARPWPEAGQSGLAVIGIVLVGVLAGVCVGSTVPVVGLGALLQDTLPIRSRRQEQTKSSRCHRENNIMEKMTLSVCLVKDF